MEKVLLLEKETEQGFSFLFPSVDEEENDKD